MIPDWVMWILVHDKPIAIVGVAAFVAGLIFAVWIIYRVMR